MEPRGGDDWKRRLRESGLVRPRGVKSVSRRPATTPAGRAGEETAARYLEDRGVALIGRNVRAGALEIDLVGSLGELLLFVEVKWRRTAARGMAAEAVTPEKRRRVVRAARAWLAEHPALRTRRVRFDVVAIQDEPREIAWIEGAFDANS